MIASTSFSTLARMKVILLEMIEKIEIEIKENGIKGRVKNNQSNFKIRCQKLKVK